MEEATDWHTNIMVVHDMTGYRVFDVGYIMKKKKNCASSMVAIFTGCDSLRMKTNEVCCHTKKWKDIIDCKAVTMNCWHSHSEASVGSECEQVTDK
jgi:hypothetical protein